MPDFAPETGSNNAKAFGSWTHLAVRLSIKLPANLQRADRIALNVRKSPKLRKRG